MQTQAGNKNKTRFPLNNHVQVGGVGDSGERNLLWASESRETGKKIPAGLEKRDYVLTTGVGINTLPVVTHRVFALI